MDGGPGLELEEAVDRLLAAAAPVEDETIAVADAGRRVAAEDIEAPVPVPSFARSAMDGYVCHDADVREADPSRPVALRLSGRARPGEVPGRGPGPGEAWWITTGAPLPGRGDRVLPLETVRRVGDEVRIGHAPPAKTHVAAPGEEIAPGALLVRRGEVIGATAVGALAACSVRGVRVHRRLSVSLVATGDELVEAGGDAGSVPAGRIVNSNAVTLDGLLREFGCNVQYAGIVRDDAAEIRARFAALAQRADLVVSTGGVSVGRYDLVHRAWLDLGAQRIVGRVSLKPGGPFFAGRLGAGTWALGLSGTPVACLAGFHLLARPLLARLSGRRDAVRPTYEAVLTEGIETPVDRMRAVWARAAGGPGGRPAVRLLRGLSAGTLGGLLAANALVLLPPGTPALPAGSRVTALALDAPEDRGRLAVRPAVPAPAVLGVVGSSGAGKTTLIVELLRALTGDGLRVAAVKHAAHGFEWDRPGSDSARMLGAGAAAVVLAGPEETAVRTTRPFRDRTEAAALAIAVAAHPQAGELDLVLVEGFGHPSGDVLRVGPDERGTGGAVVIAIAGVGEVSGNAWTAEVRRAADAVRAWLASRR